MKKYQLILVVKNNTILYRFKDDKWYPNQNILDDINSDKICYDKLEELNYLRDHAIISCNYIKLLWTSFYFLCYDKKRLRNFIKLCSLSSKNCESCIFTDLNKPINNITKESEIIDDWKSRSIIQEFRRLWFNDKVGAVVFIIKITEESKKFININFNTCLYNLSHTCYIELYKSKTNNLEVIEMNPLGSDLICVIDPFNWKEETIKKVLYGYNYDIYI